MNILYVIHNVAMEGSAISFLNLLRGVVAAGHKAVVLSVGWADIPVEMKEVFDELSVKSFYYPPKFSKKEPKGFKNLQLLKNDIKWITGITWFRYYRWITPIKMLVETENIDIIHTNVGVIDVGLELSIKMHVPHVWHLREYQDLDFHIPILPSKEAFVKKLYSSDAVVTITKDILHHFELEQHQHAYTVYNGVFDEKQACLDMPKDKFFLCASRLSKEKGIDDTINAFDLFHKNHPDYKLIIAGFGMGEYPEKLKQHAAQLPCAEHIEFIGYQKDVQSLMRKATALVVASRYEGFGRMTAEAFFCGCLVIGRNTGGTKEILEETGGFLFDGDYKDIAEQMERVASLNDKEYLEMAKKSQDVAISLYSNEKYVEQITDVYKAILK